MTNCIHYERWVHSRGTESKLENGKVSNHLKSITRNIQGGQESCFFVELTDTWFLMDPHALTPAKRYAIRKVKTMLAKSDHESNISVTLVKWKGCIRKAKWIHGNRPLPKVIHHLSNPWEIHCTQFLQHIIMAFQQPILNHMAQFLSSKKILNKDVPVPPPKKEDPKSKPWELLAIS